MVLNQHSVPLFPFLASLQALNLHSVPLFPFPASLQALNLHSVPHIENKKDGT